MKPQSPEIIDHLNKVLKNELTAINQYFLHAKILADRGLTRLAEKEKKESIEEMGHADWLLDRILFLEGLPNMQDMDKLRIGENVEEMLSGDLELELVAIPDLREAIALCEVQSDFTSRDLLEKILLNEEEHVDWLETQLGLIKDAGIQNYIQAQMAENG
ncbi:MAG: bacterioferritin [Gammaproteobacteria bacterium]|jgi:bacterioferritin|nr:bacterioferritin [Gammaproteobacteria bacterium]MBT4494942.1 bacterioferritin [Gammaproteobacteria bacterium]MBT7370258.1 bacterioferritin [Gammaproteobacteria bacterium]